MGYEANWRGTVGIVNPTKGTGSIEELTRLLPPGIGLIVAHNNIRHGTIGEFQSVMDSYKAQVRAFGTDPERVDAIHPAGTPPFMVLGYEREQELVREWEHEFGIPVFTSGMNQVRAMRALGVQRFVGIGYDFDDTSIVGNYFTSAGLDPVALVKLPGEWDRVGAVSSHTVYGTREARFPGTSRRGASHLPARQQVARPRYRRCARTGPWCSRYSSSSLPRMGDTAPPACTSEAHRVRSPARRDANRLSSPRAIRRNRTNAPVH